MSSLSLLSLLFLGWLTIGLTVPVPQDSVDTDGGHLSKEDIVKLLKNVTMFSNLSDDKIKKIADIAVLTSYPAGAKLNNKRSIYSVVANGGPVGIYENSYNGRNVEIKKLQRGDTFVQNEKNGTVSLIAEADVQALSLDKDAVKKIVGDQIKLDEAA